jgi:uncharacterized membrane protein
MTTSTLHYFPVALPFLLVLAAVFAITVTVVATRALSFASTAMGIGPWAAVAVLLLSLLGSYVNIPVAVLRALAVLYAGVASPREISPAGAERLNRLR